MAAVQHLVVIKRSGKDGPKFPITPAHLEKGVTFGR